MKKPKQEGNKYDKILKENIKMILMPFVKKRLGVKIKIIQPLPEKLQTTLEREVDSSSLVETVEGDKFILHLEFEVNPTKDMIYRMGEYHGIEMRKSKLPIKHYVFYLGEKKTKIRTRLKPEEIFSGFELFNMREESPESYLQSEMPEEVILALLADYPKDQADHIFDGILQRLHSLCNPTAMKKYQKQLTILSRMRKLEELTEEQIIDMPIHYDIETDGLFLKGLSLIHISEPTRRYAIS